MVWVLSIPASNCQFSEHWNGVLANVTPSNDSTYKYCASDINTVMNITGFHCASTSKVQLHTFSFNTGQTPVVVFESTTVTVYRTQTTINPAASIGPSNSNSAPIPTAPSQSGPVPAPHPHNPSEAPAPPDPSTNTHPPASPNAGTIAGISVGGVAALSILAAFLWYRYRVTGGWPWSARKDGSTAAAQAEKPLPPPPAYPEEKSGVVELPGQKLAHEMGDGGAVARVSELPVGAEKVNAGGEVYELDGGAVEGDKGEEVGVGEAPGAKDVKEREEVAGEEVEVKKNSD
ncbi:hypothetical protein BS50DRAFT_669257 [Corynespora cassiicola Philippines]|uniref:Uncharacterized protein n=1 Tax=Corynespora cassiicola Philippines TaxID=1448308 RepID=A0A2T2NLV2_CORCC|nr:hypothetical protein BS50DRAFT_669257 [Corynespora cassiicola Philippines]